MAQPAPRPARAPVVVPASATASVDPAFGTVAAGGPIAELVRSVEERLAADTRREPGGGLLRRASGTPEPSMLAAACALIALRLF